MNLAVMQPYLFPYIGYFHLIYAADLFLIYDDVHYIKQGFVNRNNVLSANGVTRFSVPVPGGSSNRLISELEFSPNVEKILRTIEQCYSKTPYFEPVFKIVQDTLKFEDRRIASVCQKGFNDILAYLEIDKTFRRTSELEYDRNRPAQERLIEFCRTFGADRYINTPGGRALYTRKDFTEHGIDLRFVDPIPVEYCQGTAEFVPYLSIIDILMHCSPGETRALLTQYTLA
ncbi:MAG: WbqC family protein [Pseudomonadaceae bacterium]